jgi:hypothetical protein
MSTKTICDGCGNEIKPWKPGGSGGDGLGRTVRLSTGNNHQEWDLCDPCQGRVADTLAEILPHTPPREDWMHAIRPKRTAS